MPCYTKTRTLTFRSFINAIILIFELKRPCVMIGWICLGRTQLLVPQFHVFVTSSPCDAVRSKASPSFKKRATLKCGTLVLMYPQYQKIQPSLTPQIQGITLPYSSLCRLNLNFPEYFRCEHRNLSHVIGYRQLQPLSARISDLIRHFRSKQDKQIQIQTPWAPAPAS